MTRPILAMLLLLVSGFAVAKNVTVEVIAQGGCPVAAEADDPCGNSEDVCFRKGEPNKISWRYRGRTEGLPDFQIVMKNSSDHMIFDSGCHQSAKKISCNISSSAPAGSYAYSIVNADGCEYDPKIIINDE